MTSNKPAKKSRVLLYFCWFKLNNDEDWAGYIWKIVWAFILLLHIRYSSENGINNIPKKQKWVVVVKAIRLRVLTTLLGCIKQKRVGTKSLICSFYNSMLFFFIILERKFLYISKNACILYICGWSEAKKKSSILKLYIVWLPRVYIIMYEYFE